MSIGTSQARDSVAPMRTSVLLVALLLACGPNERAPGGGGGGGGGNEDGCSDDAKLVYVVDSNNTMSKFDPATKTFTNLGTLNCPAQSGASPFSMGLDRNAIAWVLYSSGELFRVDTTNLNCAKSTWTSQQGLTLFGMGFSTDMQGGTTDTLFVAGGGAVQTGSSATLATLNTQTFTATIIGEVSGWPELTGTGSAELWGWFPSDALGLGTPRVAQIDKATGATIKSYPLQALAGAPSAWAFAFWGGDFWIFLQKDLETSTTVYQIDGTTGSMKGSTPAPGRTIVGAGVSTCAPIVIL